MSDLEHDWDLSWENWASSISDEMQKLSQSEHYPFVMRELKSIEPGGLFLDAGSELGRWVFVASQMGYSSFGIDLSPKGLLASRKYAIDHGLDCQFIAGDLRALPISSESFNLVQSLGAIEHFSESAKAIEEYYRILCPGGRCFITTPNTFSFHGAFGYKVLTLLKNRRLGYLGYEDTYTPKSLERMMKNVGFTEIKSGILPTPFLFGVFYVAIPLIGRQLQKLLGRISYLIESRQKVIGFMSYALGHKSKQNV
jgi:SAM-dependent methyltransferase